MTHFSVRLAEILDLPLIHLDKEYWRPGWDETDREEWIKKHNEIISRDSWIIDGLNSATLKDRFKAADGVIFLDTPTLMCRINLITRRMKYRNKPREDLPEDCEEFIREDEWRGLKFAQEKRNRIHTYLRRYPKTFKFTLYNRREQNRFLNELRQGKEPVSKYMKGVQQEQN